MPERSIRFGITDRKRNSASTWKLWTLMGVKKSDIYLVCRALGGKLKASLHESGNWRIAFTQETFKQEVEGTLDEHHDRVIEKWPRPEPIGEGTTLAYRIVTPWSSVISPIRKTKSEIIWIQNAPKSKATEIDIIITAPNTLVTNWPGKRSMGTSLVSYFQTENGETVWVVYWVIEMPNLPSIIKGSPHYFKGMGPHDLKKDNLRAIVFCHEKDGSRVMYDLAVKQDNKVKE